MTSEEANIWVGFFNQRSKHCIQFLDIVLIRYVECS